MISRSKNDVLHDFGNSELLLATSCSSDSSFADFFQRKSLLLCFSINDFLLSIDAPPTIVRVLNNSLCCPKLTYGNSKICVGSDSTKYSSRFLRTSSRSSVESRQEREYILKNFGFLTFPSKNIHGIQFSKHL